MQNMKGNSIIQNEISFQQTHFCVFFSVSSSINCW